MEISIGEFETGQMVTVEHLGQIYECVVQPGATLLIADSAVVIDQNLYTGDE